VQTRLIARFGRRFYLAGYSLVSLALLAWIIAAAQRAPYLPLWQPAPWQALVPVLVMPLAAWLLLAGLVEPNPLSISLRTASSKSSKSEPGSAIAVTRHPLLWAFLLWASSHIPPNGDAVGLILFGGMAMLAISGFIVLDRRARQRLGEEHWRRLAAATSIVPFAAILAGRARLRISASLLVTIAAAVAAYLWFLLAGHERLIGPDPLAWLR
jgi:uncharacterized membrane protein